MPSLLMLAFPAALAVAGVTAGLAGADHDDPSGPVATTVPADVEPPRLLPTTTTTTTTLAPPPPRPTTVAPSPLGASATAELAGH